jgi:hypothetical protein
MDDMHLVLYGTLIIYNLAVVMTLRLSLGAIDLKDALREKDQRLLRDRRGAPPAAGDAGGLAAGGPPVALDKIADDTSFSRTAGAVGAMVLACLFWAIGNVVVYKLLAAPDGLADQLKATAGFFITGAALFAPYAVNQLRSVGSSHL